MRKQMIESKAVRLLRALALAAAVVLAWPPRSTPADSAPSPNPNACTSSSSCPWVVTIKNYAFVPASMTVTPGTTVQWRNDDSASHTATATDGTFDSKNLDRGQTFTFTFTKPGTYAYTCSYHPNMTAKIVVSGDASQ